MSGSSEGGAPQVHTGREGLIIIGHYIDIDYKDSMEWSLIIQLCLCDTIHELQRLQGHLENVGKGRKWCTN